MPELIVHKFGGSCLKDPNSFEKTLKIIDKFREHNMVFVCSALSGLTDYLIETAEGVADHHFKVEERISAIKERHIHLINEVFSGEKEKKELMDFLDTSPQSSSSIEIS